MIVYLLRDIPSFVMYCVNEKPRSSLLIESTDSMIIIIIIITIFIIIIIIIIYIITTIIIQYLYIIIIFTYYHYYNAILVYNIIHPCLTGQFDELVKLVSELVGLV